MRRFLTHAVAWLLPPILGFAGGCTFFEPIDEQANVVFTPADTALNTGARFQARGMMLNGYGDLYPSEHLEYSGLDPAVTVDRDGTVTGLAYGRARMMVSRGELSDTGWVSVVPAGTLALSRASEQSTVDIVNVDGSGRTIIASSGQFGGGAPAWLPGDAGLVFQFAVPGGAGSTQLFVTDLLGQNRRLVPDGPIDRVEQHPRASRDGSWVYFGLSVSGFNGGEIWRVHSDASGLERVTASASPSTGDAYPDPSPDGSQVAFMGSRFSEGGYQLAVRDLANGTERLLGVEGLLPRWSPSGSEIAYWSGDVSSGVGTIFVIGADGTGARQVSSPGRFYLAQGLDWSPDGQWLLARASTTLELIQVATGLTLPLGYTEFYTYGSWRW